MSAARVVSRMIRSRSCSVLLVHVRLLAQRWEKVSTPVKGLLISWATPAASRPIEASFSLRPSVAEWPVSISLLAFGDGVGHADRRPGKARPISPGGRMPDSAEGRPRSPSVDMSRIAADRPQHDHGHQERSAADWPAWPTVINGQEAQRERVPRACERRLEQADVEGADDPVPPDRGSARRR